VKKSYRHIISVVLLLFCPFDAIAPNLFGGDPACALHIINPILLEWLLLVAFTIGTVVGLTNFKASSVGFKVTFIALLLLNLPLVYFLFELVIGTGCLDWSGYKF